MITVLPTYLPHFVAAPAERDSVTIPKQPRWRRLAERLLMAVGLAPEGAERRRMEALFIETVDRHHDDMERICRSFAADEADRQDLMQDAMVNIWRGLQTFRGESNLRTWVYRVTLNTCVSTFRKRPKESRGMLEEADAAVASGASDYEMAQWLEAALKTLSPIDHAIIVMWLDRLPTEEIANVAGMQKQTVATRIHRIKLKLKKIYQTQKF